jgi:hypothetical protein
MDILTFPRLKISELQTLTESTLKITESLTEVEEQRQQVETEFTSFKESVLKNQARAGEKRTIDKERDRYNSGFFSDIKAEFYYPYTENTAIETVKALKELNKKYGTKVNRLPLNEETAAIDNCVKEAEAIDLTSLANSAVSRWIPLLKDANTRFKGIASEFVEESAAVSSLESASAAAPELVTAIERLVVQMFSAIHVAPSEALNKAYSELEVLFDSYR